MTPTLMKILVDTYLKIYVYPPILHLRLSTLASANHVGFQIEVIHKS